MHSSTNFVDNGVYLLLASVQVRSESNSEEYAVRVVRGATPTVLLGSEIVQQPGISTQMLQYSYMTVLTQPAMAEDVSIQVRNHDNTFATVHWDTAQIFVMRLDEDLVEDTDWFFNEDDDSGAPVSLSTTPTAFASITFTPDDAGDNWLVIAHMDWNVNSGTSSASLRIARSGEATDDAPQVTEEGEALNEVKHFLVQRGFNLGSASNTFSATAFDEAATHEHVSSRVFAINLARFEDNDFFWNESEVVATADEPTFEEIATLGFTPQTSGDFLALGFAAFDNVSAQGGWVRIQDDGTTVPTGSDTTTNASAFGFDGTDENALNQMAFLASIPTSAQTWDVDAATALFGSTAYEDRSLVYFSMELAAAPAPAGEQPMTAAIFDVVREPSGAVAY